MTPVRIQLSRRAGSRLEETSRAANGLPARKVDRTTEFGNPFRVTKGKNLDTPAKAVDAFRALVTGDTRRGRRWRAHIRGELRGVNLACWCGPAGPCHADVLLEIANTEPRCANRPGGTT